MNEPFDSTLRLDEKTSDVLSNTLNALPRNHISLGDLVERFDRRSFSSTFLLLSVLCLLPGISILAGFAMIFPAAQMALGFNSPAFPKFIREYRIAVQTLQKWSARVIPVVSKLEQFIKPRLTVLTGLLMQRILGFLITLLALIVAIPFPLSNYPPAIAVMFLSLGLLERDGLMIIVGIACSIVAMTIGISMFYLLLSWLFF